MKRALLIGSISVVMLLAGSEAVAQTRAKRAASSAPTAPVLAGVMWENQIKVERSDWIARPRPVFELTLVQSRIADGRLEFTGSYRLPGHAKAAVVTATLVSTTARSANPWPSATAPAAQPRQRAIQNAQGQQPTANNVQPPGNPQTNNPATQQPAVAPSERTAERPIERNEQTQSLFSAAETGTGCELLFLKLQPPGQPTPTQVGVVLAHQDNERGVEINAAVCRVVRALNAKENVDEAVRRLNQLLSRE